MDSSFCWNDELGASGYPTVLGRDAPRRPAL